MEGIGIYPEKLVQVPWSPSFHGTWIDGTFVKNLFSKKSVCKELYVLKSPTSEFKEEHVFTDKGR